MTSYIEVPPEPWGCSGVSPAPHPGWGGVARPPAPEGAGVGGGASLGKYSSISDTEPKNPSDLAFEALGDLEALPYDHHFHGYQPLCQDFCDHLDLCEQKGFMVRGYDTKSGKFKNIPLDYENRWAPGRRKDLSRKLDRLEYWFELQADRPVTMITLTSYHEGESIGGAWYKLNKSRTKLLKLIRKYFGDVDYFWVPEPHKSGYVHYHLAVFADVSNNKKDNKGKGIEDKFRDLWSRKYKTGNHTFGLEFSPKKDDKKIKSLKDYLSKYLRKGFLMDKWTPALLIFNAHLWATGFRMYGASKRISQILKSENDKDSYVVWLETTINDVKTIEQPDGTKETYEEERIVWDRKYIPDWLDSAFWIQDHSPQLRLYNPDPLFTYEWGRKTIDKNKGYDPTFGIVTHIEDKIGANYDNL